MNASVAIAKDDPWFSGHFPDNPVLPGVAQLKMVADLISGCVEGQRQITGLSRVKFRKIIHPGDLLDIEVTGTNIENQYTFQITSSSEDVCSGKVFFTTIK